MLAEIFLRDVEHLAIPTHTGLGILVAHLLVAVAVTGFRSERQVHHPVVRQLHLLPFHAPLLLVELERVWPLIVDGSGLGQIVEVLGAATEVLGRVGSIPKSEEPVFVETDSLAHILCIQQGQHRPQHQKDRYVFFHDNGFLMVAKIEDMPERTDTILSYSDTIPIR